jgi:hypothetical protein
VVVIITVRAPKPNSTISTGTSAVSGADRKMFTQGNSNSSRIRLLPIMMPTGIPMTMAKNTPATKVYAVTPRAFRNAGVGTRANSVMKTSEIGGMKKVSSSCPITSHSSAHRISEDRAGSL